MSRSRFAAINDFPIIAHPLRGVPRQLPLAFRPDNTPILPGDEEAPWFRPDPDEPMPVASYFHVDLAEFLDSQDD